jgi:hypothetical protein
MRLSLLLLFVWLNLTPSFALAASLNTICLNTELSLLVARVGGRVGICVSDGTNGVSVNGGEQFPLFNVVDLPIAVAVLDAVDRGQIHLNDVITIQPGDRGSVSQNSAKLDGANDLKATTQDLLVRMIADTSALLFRDDEQDKRFSCPVKSGSANRLAYRRQERRPYFQGRSWRCQ